MSVNFLFDNICSVSNHFIDRQTPVKIPFLLGDASIFILQICCIFHVNFFENENVGFDEKSAVVY